MRVSIIFICLCLIIMAVGCRHAITYPDGGYSYPRQITGRDSEFYYLPLRNIEPKTDSILMGEMTDFYEAFGEPNLSIGPMQQDEFRLTYKGFSGYPIIITLTDHKIIVKRGNDFDVNEYSEDRLSPVERIHKRLMRRYYPIQKTTDIQSYKMKRNLDSLVNLYPQLLNPDYYFQLWRKSIVPGKKPFTYTTKEIFISHRDYVNLVSQLNESGYWKLPFHMKCEHMETDGDGIILEANIGNKYNCVTDGTCEDEPTPFKYACMELVKYAKANDKIQLINQPSDETLDSTTGRN